MPDFSPFNFTVAGDAPTTCQIVLNPVSGICKGLVRAASGGVTTAAGAFLAMGTFKILGGPIIAATQYKPELTTHWVASPVFLLSSYDK